MAALGCGAPSAKQFLFPILDMLTWDTQQRLIGTLLTLIDDSRVV
jgi:hypothetical protein